MGIEDYSTNRDSNGAIPPGNIRSYDFYYQQLVNAIRQVMADLANWIRGPIFIDPGDPTKTVTFDTTAIPTGTNVNISIPGHDVNLAGVWDTIYDGAFSGAAGSKVISGMGAYRTIRINGFLIPDTVASDMGFQFSSDNGATFIGAATDYQNDLIYTSSGTGTPSAAQSNTFAALLSWGANIVANNSNPYGQRIQDLILSDFNVPNIQKTWEGKVNYFYGAGVVMGTTFGRPGTAALQTPAMNAIRFYCNSSVARNFSGYLCIEGRRG